ncbi:unnamed protein product [Danaus chrysippus]|uniref:(African queen) hypothetical protein n=1 Tax=Danaus chrysippus TaxID=151541 RepID=A0A8J2QQX3_9NEOP|nr:unnamed protein product [Danaus chrysippus]
MERTKYNFLSEKVRFTSPNKPATVIQVYPHTKDPGLKWKSRTSRAGRLISSSSDHNNILASSVKRSQLLLCYPTITCVVPNASLSPTNHPGGTTGAIRLRVRMKMINKDLFVYHCIVKDMFPKDHENLIGSYSNIIGGSRKTYFPKSTRIVYESLNRDGYHVQTETETPEVDKSALKKVEPVGVLAIRLHTSLRSAIAAGEREPGAYFELCLRASRIINVRAVVQHVSLRAQGIGQVDMAMKSLYLCYY